MSHSLLAENEVGAIRRCSTGCVLLEVEGMRLRFEDMTAFADFAEEIWLIMLRAGGNLRDRKEPKACRFEALAQLVFLALDEANWIDGKNSFTDDDWRDLIQSFPSSEG